MPSKPFWMKAFRPGPFCYFSVDHPLYSGLSMDNLLAYYSQASGVDYKSEEVFIFFDC
jgi:hypothetical protein